MVIYYRGCPRPQKYFNTKINHRKISRIKILTYTNAYTHTHTTYIHTERARWEQERIHNSNLMITASCPASSIAYVSVYIYKITTVQLEAPQWPHSSQLDQPAGVCDPVTSQCLTECQVWPSWQVSWLPLTLWSFRLYVLERKILSRSHFTFHRVSRNSSLGHTPENTIRRLATGSQHSIILASVLT